mgnify:CR=1 FL=1
MKMKKIILLLLIFSVSYSFSFAQTGTTNKAKASYYHSKFNGRKTATGEIYRDHLLTAASNIYKLGTKLLVTNMRNGKSVIVTVNDRMATHIKGRVDLSRSAFNKIASLSSGVVHVVVEVISNKTILTETEI